MTLTANQQTELEKPVTRIVYFAEFNFASGMVRVSTLNQNLDWGGFTWIGLGAIGNITPISEAQGTAAQSLTFTLNLANSSWLAESVLGAQDYRGRSAKLYFCPLNEQFQLVDTPQVCWRGTMDVMTSEITGKRGESAGRIALKCETSAYGLRRRATLRLNAAQQKQRHHADTGFDFLVGLLANPYPWLSIKFQTK